MLSLLLRTLFVRKHVTRHHAMLSTSSDDESKAFCRSTARRSVQYHLTNIINSDQTTPPTLRNSIPLRSHHHRNSSTCRSTHHHQQPVNIPISCYFHRFFPEQHYDYILATMKKAIAFTLLTLSSASAFVPSTSSSSGRPATTSLLKAEEQSSTTADSRRNFLAAAASAVLAAATVTTTTPEPAHATYSAYTHREQDWQQRQTSGDVQYSSARALRSQLAEIAPANSERSRIFCPNGPSSAVSPLMENRCGDQQATASVFGRTQDALGNSIPGFADGYSFSKAQAGADAGGMPDYGFTTNSRKSK